MEVVKPKVSVIIPAYNTEKYISKCISSILDQSYGDYEILVIDDCSDDNTLKKVEIFNSSKIRIISNERNMGRGYARNVGLRAAKGDYIYFVDADDWISKYALEILINSASLKKADIVFCNICVRLDDSLDEEEIIQGEIDTIGTRDILICELKDENSVWGVDEGKIKTCVAGSLIRKQYIGEVLFQDNMETSEDKVFLLELLSNAYRSKNDICYAHVNGDLYYYRKGLLSNTQMSISNTEKTKCRLLLENRRLEFYEEIDDNYSLCQKSRALRMITMWETSKYIEEKDIRKHFRDKCYFIYKKAFRISSHIESISKEMKVFYVFPWLWKLYVEIKRKRDMYFICKRKQRFQL